MNSFLITLQTHKHTLLDNKTYLWLHLPDFPVFFNIGALDLVTSDLFGELSSFSESLPPELNNETNVSTSHPKMDRVLIAVGACLGLSGFSSNVLLFFSFKYSSSSHSMISSPFSLQKRTITVNPIYWITLHIFKFILNVT